MHFLTASHSFPHAEHHNLIRASFSSASSLFSGATFLFFADGSPIDNEPSCSAAAAVSSDVAMITSTVLQYIFKLQARYQATSLVSRYKVLRSTPIALGATSAHLVLLVFDVQRTDQASAGPKRQTDRTTMGKKDKQTSNLAMHTIEKLSSR